MLIDLSGYLRLGGMSLHDARRYSNRKTITWYVLEHYSIGADRYVVANRDCSKDFGARSNVNAVADFGCAAYASVTESYGYSVTNDHVVAKGSIATNNDVAKF
jgi:hypothetical protein